ncbi:MAG: PEP-CTERM sorting domain-containing protein [Verrucomicrobiota bacterium]
MNRSPSTATIASHLKTIALGASAGAATTAGIGLAPKAEAGVPIVSGFFVNSDPVTVSNGTIFNINLVPLNLVQPISLNIGSSIGWNFDFNGSTLSIYGINVGSFLQYQFFAGSYGANGFYSDTQNFDLASFDSSFFQASNSIALSPPDTVYIGLRRTDTILNVDVNGWTRLDLASISHVQTAFNFNNPSNITIGQVPEPSSATLLLAAGATGLLTARRRRKRSTHSL